MKCFICGTTMCCTDDAYSIGLEEEIYKCPKCHSSAWVKYNDGSLDKVNWHRNNEGLNVNE